MTIWGALAGGFVGTLVLTSGLRLATELRLTRIDLPLLLGTAFTADRRRAAALGYLLHFVAGLIFAVAYYAVFEAIGQSSWWLGAGFGFLHAVFAGTALVNVLLPIVHPHMATVHTAANSSPELEPPGFLLLNYGTSTPLPMVALHIAYGAVVGEFTALSG
jgi:ABC-type polysaccharide/polyol phosphate export permease